MTNRKSTKRALLGSVVAMVLCLAMLVGATFAWFTDTASTGVNKIQAGNLDVQLVDENGNSLEGKTLEFKKAANAAEGEAVLWEPGCTYELPAVYVKNNGNLALKYKVTITGINGSAKLNDVIDWTINDADLSADHSLAAGATSEALTIKGHMKESAGNEYMNESIDGIAITVAATQDTVENDSFGNTYDKDAEYPIVAMDTLQELINNATEPVSAKLEGNIAGSLTVPQGKDVTLDLNGFTLTGGDSHAILNHGTLCIKDSSGNGKIVASKANTSALRNAAVCVIDGGTFTRAAGVDNKWHTVENFGTMTFNGGKVIAEDGQSFAIVNGWNYIDPGEQKATMTINNIEMKAGPNGLKNCAGGTLTMNGGTLHCTGFWGLSNDSTGVATINGGEIISDKYVAISNGGAKMEINGGTFTGPQGSLYVQHYAHDTVVKGGSYQNETVEFMQNYCAEGYTATLKDGMVVVSEN
ncbi:MAG: SipW-dependent-type signal peptide-containing protein [Firmicutes bacterium]|nr:SipW-dependent-type signal peptide-containing protein [Bacillota bacterium]